jgi:excinuclease ABC subunit A
MGTPETIAAEPRSYTGQFLKELLVRRPGKRAQAAE